MMMMTMKMMMMVVVVVVTGISAYYPCQDPQRATL